MSTLQRSLNVLLRTSKLAAKRPSAVNPVQYVLSHNRMSVRGMAAAFERNKPHVNIGKLTRYWLRPIGYAGQNSDAWYRYHWTC